MTAEPGRRATAIVAAGAVVALATLVTGLLVEDAGTELGVPSPPFNLRWAPDARAGWALLAVAVLAATVWSLPHLLRRPRAPLGFAAASFGVALALRLVVAAAREGTDGWSRAFQLDRYEGPNEYLPALPATDYGARFLLDRFAELVPSFPVHVAGHPPGLLLTLHWLGIDGAGGMAALVIGVAALSAPLTYALGRELLDGEAAARIAALLFALSPSAIWMGAASADALFATLGAGAAVLLLAGRPWLRAAGAVALAVASLFSWALLATGAFVVIVTLLRRGLRAAVVLAVLCGAALVAFHAALWAATGWDPLGTIRATEEVYRLSIAQVRPYWFWVVGSPVAALVATGLPIAAWWLRAVTARDAAALAILAVILVAAIGGFSKAEVERIWVPFVPFLAVAAASALPQRRLVLAGALLAVQALAVELLLDTLW